jgi:transmembrane sensor
LPNEHDSERPELPLPEERVASFDAEVWRLTAPPIGPDGWAELGRRIERHESRPPLAFVRPASHRWRTPLRAAAVLVVGIGLGLAAARLHRPPAPVAARTVVTVPAAATATLRLPGGVVAHLNAASTLTYVEAGGAVREVELDGQAYFEVPHDPKRTFAVRTAAGVVRDLGTEFDVRARDSRVEVVVAKGAVELAAAQKTVTVHAGQRSSASLGHAPRPAAPADVAAALAWMDGTLVFIDEPLASVAAELNRHYGVTFRVAGSLRDDRITATIRTPSSADAARAVCAAIAATCQPEDAGWRISPAP